jgi:serine phosphatase RsbU (regulator of sigma subunit)
MNKHLTIQLKEVQRLLMARLSRRVVFWMFLSFMVIEGILLIPSVQRQQQKLLEQAKEVTTAKMLWITMTYPQASPNDFFAYVQALRQDPMTHMILGGAVYRADGRLINTFGEVPELTLAEAISGDSMLFQTSDRLYNNRYDVAWSTLNPNTRYVVILRHDITSVQRDLNTYILQTVGLVIIIAAFITVMTLVAQAPLVMMPILKLRQDLLLAGDAVSQDQPPPVFYSTSVKRQDELGDVIAAFNQMFQQIWQAISDRKQAEQELAIANQEITALNQQLTSENVRLSAELEVTRKLQQMLLPKEEELRQIPDLDIAGFMEPATEVGGDYYDVLAHDGTVKIGIGDVTGHGLESGVLMIMAQTATRALIANNETDPVKFLNTLNQTIFANAQRMNCDKSLTLSLLDYQNGQVRVSGQHEDVLLVRADGALERINTIDLGFPLGLEADITQFIAQTQIQLNSGDGLILYTDGVTEAANMAGELYSLDRLCHVARHNWHLSAQAIQHAIMNDLQNHIGQQEIYDDITLVILKQK